MKEPVRFAGIEFAKEKQIHIAQFRNGSFGIRFVRPISALVDLHGLKPKEIRAKKVASGEVTYRRGNKRFQEVVLSPETMTALCGVLRNFPHNLKTRMEWGTERSK